MGIPRGLFHGEEADISGDMGGDALHVTDDAVAFVGLPFKEVEGILDAGAADALELGAEERLVLGLRCVIRKHHEH